MEISPPPAVGIPPPEDPLNRFGNFVLSTCSPSHVRAARKGVEDWRRIDALAPIYRSDSTGMVHVCDSTCANWVIRFLDGVKVCAISGTVLTLANARATNSPLKRRNEVSCAFGSGDALDNAERMMEASEIERYETASPPKRFMDKPIPGSSVALMEQFGITPGGGGGGFPRYDGQESTTTTTSFLSSSGSTATRINQYDAWATTPNHYT